jgi:hypothetical protein
MVVRKPWRCHIQGLFVSQLNTFCFAIYLILGVFSRYVVGRVPVEFLGSFLLESVVR